MLLGSISKFAKVLCMGLINSPYEVKYRWNEYHDSLKYQ